MLRTADMHSIEYLFLRDISFNIYDLHDYFWQSVIFNYKKYLYIKTNSLLMNYNLIFFLNEGNM